MKNSLQYSLMITTTWHISGKTESTKRSVIYFLAVDLLLNCDLIVNAYVFFFIIILFIKITQNFILYFVWNVFLFSSTTLMVFIQIFHMRKTLSILNFSILDANSMFFFVQFLKTIKYANIKHNNVNVYGRLCIEKNKCKSLINTIPVSKCRWCSWLLFGHCNVLWQVDNRRILLLHFAIIDCKICCWYKKIMVSSEKRNGKEKGKQIGNN